MAEGKGNLLAYVVLTLALSVIIAETIALVFYGEENSRIKFIERDATDLAEKNRILRDQNTALLEELEKLRSSPETPKPEEPLKTPNGAAPKPDGGQLSPSENETWK